MATTSGERGFVLVTTSLLLSSLLFLFSLVGDLGRIFLTKGELQNVTDAAALAAVSELPNGADVAREKGNAFGQVHWTAGQAILLSESDVQLGRYDFEDGFISELEPYNAVRVFARRTSDAPSGALGLLFAPLFGRNFSNVSALAVAMLDSHIVGVQGKNRLIPYSVIEELTDQNHDGMIDIGAVINVFPNDAAPGNFGVLDFDGGENGIPETRRWIEEGYDYSLTIPPGGSLPIFGSPGINGQSVLNSFEVIMGEIVFLPVHRTVVLEGSNAVFSVVNIVAARVNEVVLTGSQEDRRIMIELIRFASSVLVTDPSAPENPSLAKPRLVI